MAKVPDWYQSRNRKVRERSLTALFGIVLAIFVGLSGIVFAYYFLPDSAGLSVLDERNSDPDRLVFIEFEDSEIVVPANLISRIKSRTLRGVQQIDLQFAWPYAPGAPAVKPEDIKDYSNYVLVSIIRRPEGFSDQERFDKIYKTYFAGSPRPSVSNLWHYAFLPQSPYASIDLYLGQLQKDSVFITCAKEASSLGPRLCERLISVNDRLTLRYRFAFEHLRDWHRIEATIGQIINQVFHFKANGTAGSDS